jgi:hypothetical protein
MLHYAAAILPALATDATPDDAKYVFPALARDVRQDTLVTSQLRWLVPGDDNMQFQGSALLTWPTATTTQPCFSLCPVDAFLQRARVADVTTDLPYGTIPVHIDGVDRDVPEITITESNTHNGCEGTKFSFPGINASKAMLVWIPEHAAGDDNVFLVSAACVLRHLVGADLAHVDPNLVQRVTNLVSWWTHCVADGLAQSHAATLETACNTADLVAERLTGFSVPPRVRALHRLVYVEAAKQAIDGAASGSADGTSGGTGDNHVAMWVKCASQSKQVSYASTGLTKERKRVPDNGFVGWDGSPAWDRRSLVGGATQAGTDVKADDAWWLFVAFGHTTHLTRRALRVEGLQSDWVADGPLRVHEVHILANVLQVNDPPTASITNKDGDASSNPRPVEAASGVSATQVAAPRSLGPRAEAMLNRMFAESDSDTGEQSQPDVSYVATVAGSVAEHPPVPTTNLCYIRTAIYVLSRMIPARILINTVYSNTAVGADTLSAFGALLTAFESVDAALSSSAPDRINIDAAIQPLSNAWLLPSAPTNRHAAASLNEAHWNAQYDAQDLIKRIIDTAERAANENPSLAEALRTYTNGVGIQVQTTVTSTCSIHRGSMAKVITTTKHELVVDKTTAWVVDNGVFDPSAPVTTQCPDCRDEMKMIYSNQRELPVRPTALDTWMNDKLRAAGRQVEDTRTEVTTIVELPTRQLCIIRNGALRGGSATTKATTAERLTSVVADVMYTFRLSAAMIHSGFAATSGHYFTLIRCDDKWVKFDDHSVTNLGTNFPAAVLVGASYLVYDREWV